MKLITQEAPLGCAIACAASLANVSYQQMGKYFDNRKIKEKTVGFHNRDIVVALSKMGIKTKVISSNKCNNRKIKIGTIVFTKRSKKYPVGHYLLKTPKGWMNSWINYPNIKPAKAGFQRTLPNKIRWVIEPVE
jgi:ABC-type bacteriocin/lantibiotic exporter with double-glycine peptidase domain